MSEITYHIRIKKNYAFAIIEDLKQIDAIEIFEDAVPEWQKCETLKRLARMTADPSTEILEDEFFESLDDQE